jgi:peptidoglycan/xylan/chitin deacetylase (PgdA/CDA1 family)
LIKRQKSQAEQTARFTTVSQWSGSEVTQVRGTEGVAEKSQVAILGYHKIGRPSASAWDTWYYISEEIFERQLRCIAESGWEVIDAARFLQGLNDAGSLPDRSVLLTFDDGYQSILRCALPHLNAFGFPAVIFVPTGFVGDVSRFDENTSEPMEPICSWDELRELQRGGISVESHGVSHCRFSAVDRSRLVFELESSRRAIIKELGANSEIFAFPYSDPGSDYRVTTSALVDAGYRCAFLYRGGAQSFPVSDVYRIARIPVGREIELGQILTSP